MERIVIKINDCQYSMTFSQLQEDVDVDELLQIDYGNLIGEIVTFPVIVNKLGLILADAESALAESKLNLEIHEAKVKERIRMEVQEKTGKAPTVEALNNALIVEKSYQVMRKKVIECQKMRDYVNATYWAAKDKSDKLSKLSLTVQPGEITDAMIEGTINNVIIKRSKKLIE